MNCSPRFARSGCRALPRSSATASVPVLSRPPSPLRSFRASAAPVLADLLRVILTTPSQLAGSRSEDPSPSSAPSSRRSLSLPPHASRSAPSPTLTWAFEAKSFLGGSPGRGWSPTSSPAQRRNAARRRRHESRSVIPLSRASEASAPTRSLPRTRRVHHPLPRFDLLPRCAVSSTSLPLARALHFVSEASSPSPVSAWTADFKALLH